jgi:vanillate O-demethylase monooxygenase subunit
VTRPWPNADNIPHLDWYDDPAWAYGGGLYHIQCDYRLMIDNLMDLTHETYVHATSIGQKEIDETPCKTTVEGDTVTTSRFMSGIQAPPFWKMAPACQQPAGRPAGGPLADLPLHAAQPRDDRGRRGAGRGRAATTRRTTSKVYSIVVDFITPETETSMWYFWGMARNFRAGDKALTAQIRDGQGKIFSEDLQMLELQQKPTCSRGPGAPC